MGQGVQGLFDIRHGEDIHYGLRVKAAVVHTEAELTSLLLGHHDWGSPWFGARLDSSISQQLGHCVIDELGLLLVVPVGILCEGTFVMEGQLVVQVELAVLLGFSNKMAFSSNFACSLPFCFLLRLAVWIPILLLSGAVMVS